MVPAVFEWCTKMLEFTTALIEQHILDTNTEKRMYYAATDV
jgi:hypothetical protein